jgi:hypothetical protein
MSLWNILLYPPVLAVVLVSVGGTIFVVLYAQYLRYGFHFRLRTLLIVTTLIAVGLAAIVIAAR